MNEADVVQVYQARLREVLEPFDAAVIDHVIAQVASVPYRGDLHGYLAEAASVADVALQPALDEWRARIAAMQTQNDALEAENKRMETAFADWLRVISAFQALAVSGVIH